jgi:hypothetical protein
MTARWARSWFALTAACVLAGIVIQLVVSATNESFFGGSAINRALNVFAFFTIQSNVMVGVVCLLLAVRTDRHSNAFAVFRLTSLVAITVTFLVFHVALSGLLDLDTWAQTANQLQHTVVPVLAVVGWISFGPRGLISARTIRWSVAFPLLWMVFTAVRGPLSSDWYPYPFADVHALGYLRVAINALWIAVLFIAIAAGAWFLDGKLPENRGTRVEDEPGLQAMTTEPSGPISAASGSSNQTPPLPR